MKHCIWENVGNIVYCPLCGVIRPRPTVRACAGEPSNDTLTERYKSTGSFSIVLSDQETYSIYLPDNHERQQEAYRERNLRILQPCTFLGRTTGKMHKVGCVDRYLPEHTCLCSERQMFVLVSTSGKVKPHHVRKPVAIPGGKCRDLRDEWGEVSCIDCSLYRAGLLPNPSS